MTEILLFHSALGRRPAVHAFADRLREAGHTVHVPDYYDGRVFDDLAAGVAYRDQLTIPEIARRAAAIAEELPTDLVYAGFSLGAAPAQLLAQTRPGARGAILMHGALPSAAFEVPWPASVPLTVHAMQDDPWVELPVAQALTAEAADGTLHLYSGSGHLFADPDDPDHDPQAAALMMERVLAFLQPAARPQ
jgi:dienelactone hydrolase